MAALSGGFVAAAGRRRWALARAGTEGGLFEKAGVNFSDVSRQLRPEMARSLPGDGRGFRATGISLVLHPRSPRVPTVHANLRFIQRGERGLVRRRNRS